MNYRVDSDLPSNKRFGLFIVTVLLTISLLFYYYGQFIVSAIVGVLTFSTLIICFVRPKMLDGLNRSWMRFGIILSTVFNPFVLGFIFLLFFVPIGLVIRLIGRDELSLKIKPSDSSWKMRGHVGWPDDFFDHQY